MLSKNVLICSVVTALFIFCASGHAQMKTADQIFETVDQILQSNQLNPGEKVKTIKIVERRTITLLIIRIAEGADFKFPLNKANEEVIHTIKGSGEMLVSEKWVAGQKWVGIRAESLYFNPVVNARVVKNTGIEELVIVFTSFQSARMPHVIH